MHMWVSTLAMPDTTRLGPPTHRPATDPSHPQISTRRQWRVGQQMSSWGATVERPVLEQLQVEVGRTLEDRVQSGLTRDRREERHLYAVDQTGGPQWPGHSPGAR